MRGLRLRSIFRGYLCLDCSPEPAFPCVQSLAYARSISRSDISRKGFIRSPRYHKTLPILAHIRLHYYPVVGRACYFVVSYVHTKHSLRNHIRQE